MADEKTLGSLELFQLKECYELAALCANDETAQKIMREKVNIIGIPKDYIPAQDDAVYQESEMQIISAAMYALTLERNESPSNAVIKYKDKIDSLPESGEKEYILTLLSLRKGTTESNRIEALGHLSAALAYTPHDMRMITMARILKDV